MKRYESTEKVAKSVKELTDETLKNTAAQKGSINALTKQRARLEELRGNLDPTSKTFARLTKEIAKTNVKEKMRSRTLKRGYTPTEDAEVKLNL